MLKILLALLPALLAGQDAAVVIGYDPNVEPLRFAAAEIRSSIRRPGIVSETEINAALKSPAPTRIIMRVETGGKPQAYQVRSTKAGPQTTYTVSGDVVGAMYGGLEFAESLRTGIPIADGNHAPHIEQRGIKFNIPLDARTPSYSDNSDAAQGNIPEMWSFDFWREFIDEMARHRYNVLSLWNLHPFPSMVKVPEYPDVALDDVKRTTVKLDDSFSHSGHDMVRPNMLENLETVRRMSIAEKIQFWRDVMQYARNRGVDVYLFTWNIFTWGAQGKHGITQSQTNPITIDYFRKSVREAVLTYPLLAGIGITAGEQMENRKDEFSKEKWLWKTYGEGIRDALQAQPGRQFRLIHRFHQTGFREIQSEWKDYPGPFDLSFKYSIAHMYSSPKPPFINDALPYLNPKMRTWLTVRNDDIYSFRWGDPAYAREYIRNIPGRDKVAGFYMGPDGYIWGREFLSTEPRSPRELVMKKQWYSFLLWGRLSYDPELPDARLNALLAQRFPEVPPERLGAAWARASRVFPEITKFAWGDIDLRWFPEANLSHKRYRGFYTVRHFIEGPVMPGSGNVDVLTWRDRSLSKQPLDGRAPGEVADALASNAAAALTELSALRSRVATNAELRITLNDIECMAHLGNYYAEKIRAAAALGLFDKTGDRTQQQAAVQHLNQALDHWKRYAAAYSKHYKPQLLNRVGFIDIPALTSLAAADVEMAKSWQPGTLKDRPKTGADRPFNP